MKMGAHGYVPKPFKIDELQMTMQRALEFQSARQENTYLRKELKNKYKFENIIGTSRKMQNVYNLINKVADTDSTVLIQGESGTGKELVARGLHFNSNRQHHPFVAINCSALPGKFARVGTVRSQERRLHRSGRGQARAFRGGEPRHDFPRRSELHGDLAPDETAPRPAGTRSAPGGRQQERAGQRPRGRRDQRAAPAENPRRYFPRRSLLPAGGHPGGDPRPSRAAGGRATAGQIISCKSSPAQTGDEPKKIDHEAVRITRADTIIRATCASWRTPSSALARLCEDDMIMPGDLPPQIVEMGDEEAGRKARGRKPSANRSTSSSREQEREYIEATLAKYKDTARRRPACSASAWPRSTASSRSRGRSSSSPSPARSRHSSPPGSIKKEVEGTDKALARDSLGCSTQSQLFYSFSG